MTLYFVQPRYQVNRQFTTMDVRHIGVSVVDNDHSDWRIIQKIEASDYFNLSVTESYDDSFTLLEGGEADVILTIPNDFRLSLIGDSPKRIGMAAGLKQRIQSPCL